MAKSTGAAATSTKGTRATTNWNALLSPATGQRTGRDLTFITLDELETHRGHLTMALIECDYDEGKLGIACKWPRVTGTPNGEQ